MANPQFGFNWTNVTAAGTTIMSDRSGDLIRVYLPGTYVGTVILNDASASTGTTQIVAVGLPASAIPQNIEIGAKFSGGLTAVATGTPTLTVIWN